MTSPPNRTENMLERVARAIAKAEGADPDGWLETGADSYPGSLWTDYLPHARAAIQAMRADTMEDALLEIAAMRPRRPPERHPADEAAFQAYERVATVADRGLGKFQIDEALK